MKKCSLFYKYNWKNYPIFIVLTLFGNIFFNSSFVCVDVLYKSNEVL